MTPAPARPAPPPRPQLPALGEALVLFAESVAHRAELAGLEIGEARDHAFVSTVMAGFAGAFVLFTGFAFTFLVAGLVWDGPHRAVWLGALSILYLAGAVVAAVLLRRRLRTWRPLGETHLQLKQDYQCLSSLIKSAVR